MVQKHLAEYLKDRKSFQSSISNDCWKCHSKNTQKVDSGIAVLKCKDCGSTTKYFDYATWIKNIKHSSKYSIKSAKEAILELKAEKLRKDKDIKNRIADQMERIKRAKEMIRSVK